MSSPLFTTLSTFIMIGSPMNTQAFLTFPCDTTSVKLLSGHITRLLFSCYTLCLLPFVIVWSFCFTAFLTSLSFSLLSSTSTVLPPGNPSPLTHLPFFCCTLCLLPSFFFCSSVFSFSFPSFSSSCLPHIASALLILTTTPLLSMFSPLLISPHSHHFCSLLFHPALSSSKSSALIHLPAPAYIPLSCTPYTRNKNHLPEPLPTDLHTWALQSLPSFAFTWCLHGTMLEIVFIFVYNQLCLQVILGILVFTKTVFVI